MTTSTGQTPQQKDDARALEISSEAQKMIDETKKTQERIRHLFASLSNYGKGQKGQNGQGD